MPRLGEERDPIRSGGWSCPGLQWQLDGREPARGAARGAIIGAIAGDAGKGAAIGAGAGAIGGIGRRRAILGAKPYEWGTGLGLRFTYSAML